MENARDFNPYILGCNMVLAGPSWNADMLFPSRTVQWYELELITQCDCGGVITDGEFVKAQVGGLYLRRPGMVVQGVSRYRWSHIVFDSRFDPALSGEYAQPFISESVFDVNERILADHHAPLLEQLPRYMVLSDSHYMTAYNLFRHCYVDFMSKRPDFQFHAKAVLFQLLHLAMDEHASQRSNKKCNSEVQDCVLTVKDYLDEKYMEAITLEMMARRAMLSESYLCRMFKETLGVSPIEYLMQVRVSTARRLLSSTHIAVAEIGRMCGFRTESHFFQTFKRITGFTPNAYRRQTQHAL